LRTGLPYLNEGLRRPTFRRREERAEVHLCEAEHDGRSEGFDGE
jgi:hypothetical protein